MSTPFDVLGAQTEGMLGYLIEQELGNRIGNDRVIATFVTRTVVDRNDPAFDDPSNSWARSTTNTMRRGWPRPDALDAIEFPAGSMGPKVAAAQQFVREGRGGECVIGSLGHMDTMFDGGSGTVVSKAAAGIEYRTPHVASSQP